ncbi:MAG: hypothetical protein RBT37_04560 [Dissulfurispiraceae bacterium]|jgi:uncharacterized protein YjgD (DUF1641 family)|nr:hypothetical protein [Dissulfurispiraceae bacterium]
MPDKPVAPDFDPETLKALNELLSKVSDLQKSGAMDTLHKMLDSIPVCSRAGETAVKQQGHSLNEALTELSSPEIINSIRELKEVYRSGKLKDLFEMTDAVPLFLNTVTEKMLERNISMAGTLLKIANEAADPAMIEAVREIKNLQKTGNLKLLSESSYLIGLVANVVTDSMVQRLVTVLSAFVEEVSTPQMQDILRSVTKCMTKTIKEFANTPPEPNLSNILRIMRDPEVRMGMMFMASLSKNMYNSLTENYNN